MGLKVFHCSTYVMRSWNLSWHQHLLSETRSYLARIGVESVRERFSSQATILQTLIKGCDSGCISVSQPDMNILLRSRDAAYCYTYYIESVQDISWLIIISYKGLNRVMKNRSPHQRLEIQWPGTRWEWWDTHHTMLHATSWCMLHCAEKRCAQL